MLNLIIDGDYLLYSSFFSLAKDDNFYNSPDPQPLTEYALQKLNWFTRTIECPINNCIFVFDGSSSWRKQYKMEHRHFIYKEGRNEKQRVSLDHFKGYKKAFMSFVKKNGFITFYSDKLEGDDWLYIVPNSPRVKEQYNLIFSGDSDLYQLLRNRTKDAAPVVQYSATEHYVISDVESVDNDSDKDFFNMEVETPEDRFYNKCLSQSNLVINPYEKMLAKILAGDSGDKIPSVSYKSTKGGPVAFGVTSAEKFVEALSEDTEINEKYMQDLYESDSARLEMAKNITLKQKVPVSNATNISVNIKENFDMIGLTHYTLPKDYTVGGFKVVDKKVNDMEMKMIHRSLYDNRGFLDLESMANKNGFSVNVRYSI